MTSLAIDTYRVAKTLKSKGYTEQQAAAFVEVLQEIDLEHVATKEDIHRVEVAIRAR